MSAEESLQNEETAAEKKKRLAAEKKAEEEAEKLEKQKQEADLKAAKEAEKEKQARAKRKKEGKETLEDLAIDYGIKQIDGLSVPAYFHRKERYADAADETVDKYHAKNFLLGMEIFEDQGSCSAKFTYIGPNRRYSIDNVRVGKREPRPTQNNWKIFPAPLRMVNGDEHSAKVKDPKVIRDFLTTQGGKKNFKVRFVQDKEFTQEEVKKKVYAKDPVRLKNLNYRIKKDQAKMGIKPYLRNKKEALLLLNDLGKEVKDNRADHVIKFLKKEITKYNRLEKKQKEEALKD